MMNRPITQGKLRQATEQDARFTIIHGKGLPNGWKGKPYASDNSQRPALFVLINAPHAKASDGMLPAQVDEALAKWGISADNIALREVYPTSYIEQQFATRDGAIYGQASNSLKGSFFRPKNKDKTYKNLYYVGGTVHPGGGSPIVVKGCYEVAK